MNFELNKIKVDEIEINVKSIIAQCIRKLKTILVCGLILAILGVRSLNLDFLVV